MKQAVIWPLAISLLAVMFLAGCGEMGGRETDGTAPPAGTANVVPEIDDLLPDAMEPDENDGVVRDADGIITDSDSGYGKNGDGTNAVNGGPDSDLGTGSNGSGGAVTGGGQGIGTEGAADNRSGNGRTPAGAGGNTMRW